MGRSSRAFANGGVAPQNTACGRAIFVDASIRWLYFGALLWASSAFTGVESEFSWEVPE
jgi:hypothetical protein